jgi:hypothetical protein
MAIRVTSGSYDVTGDIEGLNWSSVNPGGDETCTFTLKRSWFTSSPEIERGNLLRVMDGIDVLWQGRVEETNRGGESTGEIGVTAYGLGARLKDTTMREIYIDQDFSRWGSIPNPRVVALGTSYVTDMGSSEIRPGQSGSPSLALTFTRLANGGPPYGVIETWYDAAGIPIGAIDYNRSCYDRSSGGYGNFLGGSWFAALQLRDAEVGGASNEAVIGGAQGAGTLAASGVARVFAYVQLLFLGAFTGDGEWRLEMRTLAVQGRHGLVKQGSEPSGFLNSQIIVDAVERATGITVRRVDETTFVCEQAAFFERTKIEDVVAEQNKYERHHRTWGTWGPDSPLDTSNDGYFDYRSIDDAPSWIAFRAECDSCNLHSETATLFDTVHVLYTDKSGVQREVTRTADVPDLNGIPREETVDGGTLTEAGAETFADALLALSGGFAPARGSAVLSQPIRHVTRGKLAPHYMRADGSAFRIPDVLPSPSLFALDSTPDRRTTFPIKRVSVDAASKAVPVVTVEVDQVNDAITALQARLAQNGDLRGG